MIAAAGLWLAAASGHADTVPQRVVSMNLCTDQLAMMLAGPGQLISVSDLAADPDTSPMFEAARAYPANYGGAEEIYLLRPDLVVAGTFSNPTVVAMLRRLGIRVEQLGLVQSLEQVPDRIAQMGTILGREERADAEIAAFRDDLAALSAPPDGPRAAFYYPNGYTLGTGTLSHDILTTAGYRHIAAELGRSTSGRLALELLVLADPEVVITSSPYPAASRSEALMDHPAFAAITGARGAFLSSNDWICGTPLVLNALRDLVAARE
jgi:iron complex transport system substrate-binding protein